MAAMKRAGDRQMEKKKDKKHSIVLAVLLFFIIALAGYLVYSFVTWKSDEDGHWHSIVGFQVGHEEHVFVLIESVEPTSESHGYRVNKCNVCGWTHSEPITDHVYSIFHECRICGKIEYKVGDLGPAGGYIFYDCDSDNESGNGDRLKSSECGWRFLEAAPADVSIVDGVISVDSALYDSAGKKRFAFGYFKSGNDYLLSETSMDIGTGVSNTTSLLGTIGSFSYMLWEPEKIESDYAAKACYNINSEMNGLIYHDWFLPSKAELDLMYTNLHKNGLGNFADDWYWSSSESDSINA